MYKICKKIQEIFITLNQAEFLDTKSTIHNKKTDKFDIIKVYNVCASEDTLMKIKRQVSDWSQIFADHVSDKGLVSRI